MIRRSAAEVDGQRNDADVVVRILYEFRKRAKGASSRLGQEE